MGLQNFRKNRKLKTYRETDFSERRNYAGHWGAERICLLWKYALLFPVIGLLIVADNVRAIVDMDSRSEMISIERKQAAIQGKMVDKNGKLCQG